jgi:hypothetical protein
MRQCVQQLQGHTGTRLIASLVVVTTLLASVLSSSGVSGFVVHHQAATSTCLSRHSQSILSEGTGVTHGTALQSSSSSSDNNDNSNAATDLGSFFNNMFGAKEPEQPPGPKVMVDLDFTQMKLGGLRFTLALHMMGLQNTPTKGSWKANQASDGTLDLFFQKDVDSSTGGSNSLAINFDDDSRVGVQRLWIERWGSSQPSLQYVLQESLILHNLLDELEALATGNPEEVTDAASRLIILKDADAIEQARATLPARKA